MLKFFSSKSSFVSSYEYGPQRKIIRPNRHPAKRKPRPRNRIEQLPHNALTIPVTQFLSEVHPSSLKHPPNPSIVCAVADKSTFRFNESHRHPGFANACACQGFSAVV